LLLFVHGIFGDTVETWSRTKTDSLPEMVLATPEFAGKYDAFALGFPSSLVNTGSFNIPEAAAALIMDVSFQQFLTKYERIVMVGHSMGGLVALEALTTDPLLSAKVPLLVTYATPYTGAQVTKLARQVIRNPALHDMLPGDDNAFLLSLSNRWKQAKSQKTLHTTVTCAYETVPLPGLGLVVSRTSGAGLCDGIADAIAEDHIGIVKPDTNQHPSVKVLVNALRSLPLAPVAPNSQSRQTEFLPPAPTAAAPSLLCHAAPADRVNNVEIRIAANCNGCPAPEARIKDSWQGGAESVGNEWKTNRSGWLSAQASASANLSCELTRNGYRVAIDASHTSKAGWGGIAGDYRWSESSITGQAQTGFDVKTAGQFCLLVADYERQGTRRKGYLGSHLFSDGPVDGPAIRILNPAGTEMPLSRGTTIPLDSAGKWLIEVPIKSAHRSGWAEDSGSFEFRSSLILRFAPKNPVSGCP
jgi:hypothetical protein